MAVSLRDVRKSFGRTQVLRGLDLEVGRGEYFVILGPSGEGKTTTLNIAAGIVRPDGGEVRLDGSLVDDGRSVYVPPERRNVGYVFQSYALYPHMTAFDNIAFPLKMAGRPREEIRRAVLEMAELLNIKEVLERKPAQLSGGQRQRVAVARALVKRPRALLMDEPYSNIDPLLRESVRAEIRRIIKDLGITTVMVTHDREEAMALADRLGVMRRGRLLQTGPPQEVFSRPCCPDVASFMGYNLMPLDGRLLAFRPDDVELGSGDFAGEVIDVEFRGRLWAVVARVGGAVVKAYTQERPPEGRRMKFGLRRAIEYAAE
jgi:multiple sugar transport system ATP-binding protein